MKISSNPHLTIDSHNLKQNDIEYIFDTSQDILSKLREYVRLERRIKTKTDKEECIIRNRL